MSKRYQSLSYFEKDKYSTKPKIVGEPFLGWTGERNNWIEFSRQFQEFLITTDIGQVANILITGREMEFLEIERPADASHEFGGNQPFLDWKARCEAQAKIQSMYETKKNKIFAQIMRHVSEQSERRIRAHGEYGVVGRDPIRLWRIVRDSHLVAEGTRQSSIFIERMVLSNMRLNKMNPEVYIERFVEQYGKLVYMGDEGINELSASQMLYQSLNTEPFVSQQLIWATTRDEMPDNIVDMTGLILRFWHAHNNHKQSQSLISTGGRSQQVFYGKNMKNNSGQKKESTKGTNDGVPKSGELYCIIHGYWNHTTDNCFRVKDILKEEGIEIATVAAKKSKKNKGAKEVQANVAKVSNGKEEISSDEDDEDSDHVESSFISVTVFMGARERREAHISKDSLILDSGATTNIFCSLSAVLNITRARRSTTLYGVDSANIINEVATSRIFGPGLWVPTAMVNLISLSQATTAGFIAYMDTTGGYISLSKNNLTYIFRRNSTGLYILDELPEERSAANFGLQNENNNEYDEYVYSDSHDYPYQHMTSNDHNACLVSDEPNYYQFTKEEI